VQWYRHADPCRVARIKIWPLIFDLRVNACRGPTMSYYISTHFGAASSSRFISRAWTNRQTDATERPTSRRRLYNKRECVRAVHINILRTYAGEIMQTLSTSNNCTATIFLYGLINKRNKETKFTSCSARITFYCSLTNIWLYFKKRLTT